MKNEIQEILDWIATILFALLPVAALLIFFYGFFHLFVGHACAMEKLGTISRNPFIGDSTSNPFSPYNNRFNPNSPYNRFGPYGNPFSPYSANNPYATETPGIYGYADGESSSDSYAGETSDGY